MKLFQKHSIFTWTYSTTSLYVHDSPLHFVIFLNVCHVYKPTVVGIVYGDITRQLNMPSVSILRILDEICPFNSFHTFVIPLLQKYMFHKPDTEWINRLSDLVNGVNPMHSTGMCHLSLLPIILFTITPHNITNLMEQSPSWEAKSHSASQEIPCLSWKLRFITMFTRAHNWSLSWAK